MEPLRNGLLRVLGEYPSARTARFTQHPLGGFVRGELPQAVMRLCDPSLLVKGSVGQGTWAETPWLSIFDRRITTSAQRGVYVVYLFDQQGRSVYLSLNQATTEVKEEFGARFEQVLRDRADFAHELLRPYQVREYVSGELDLTGNGELTRGYCAGNIAAINYVHDRIPSEEEISRDLLAILALYKTYVSVRNGEVGEGEELPDDVHIGQEARKYRWHRRAERNSRLSQAAKKFHGTTCMVCQFNFLERYGTRGEGYIEAHHVVPFAQLAKEVEPVTLDPRTDFVVVCANCHRMLHRSNPPITPAELKALINH